MTITHHPGSGTSGQPVTIELHARIARTKCRDNHPTGCGGHRGYCDAALREVLAAHQALAAAREQCVSDDRLAMARAVNVLVDRSAPVRRRHKADPPPPRARIRQALRWIRIFGGAA
jgi:hypothetical protein